MKEKELKEQYNKIGKQYTERQESYFSKREDWARRFIKKNLPVIKGKKLLDVGCGSGPDIKEYLGAGAEVYAIDSSSYMIEKAKEKSKEPDKILVSDVERMPFQNNTFQVVTGRFSMHYLVNLDKGYREIHRVMAPGGYLLLVVSHPIWNLLEQKEKVYGNKEIISTWLYDKTVEIKFPTHTFSDYLSEEFLKLFDLEEIGEYPDQDQEINGIRVPGALAIKATKRSTN